MSDFTIVSRRLLLSTLLLPCISILSSGVVAAQARLDLALLPEQSKKTRSGGAGELDLQQLKKLESGKTKRNGKAKKNKKSPSQFDTFNEPAAPDPMLIHIPSNPARSQDGSGTPDPAGRPDDVGKPADTGKPDDVGKPDDIGKPDDVGRPDDVGKPEGVGRPEGRGRRN